jgi:hypothetical protein
MFTIRGYFAHPDNKTRLEDIIETRYRNNNNKELDRRNFLNFVMAFPRFDFSQTLSKDDPLYLWIKLQMRS